MFITLFSRGKIWGETILRSPLQQYFLPCRASTLNTRGRKGVAWFASCLVCLKALKGMYKALWGERGEREGGTVALHRVICGVAKLTSEPSWLFNKCQGLCHLIHYAHPALGEKWLWGMHYAGFTHLTNSGLPSSGLLKQKCSQRLEGSPLFFK